MRVDSRGSRWRTDDAERTGVITHRADPGGSHHYLRVWELTARACVCDRALYDACGGLGTVRTDVGVAKARVETNLVSDLIIPRLTLSAPVDG